jgi:bis(5'-nucleosyl)-tetraphosphatase (symmetrical)
LSVYVIGDVQGCYAELRALIAKLNFNPSTDKLWFVGDLVNRGSQSLEVLRYVRELGDSAITVLGNHDLHLLAEFQKKPQRRVPNVDLERIFLADDAPELMDWLRFRPLAHYDAEYDVLMVHAGLHPDWDRALTMRSARRVENKLRAPEYVEFLTAMYGNKPAGWAPSLKGIDRLRAIVNTLTRLRYCDLKGNIAFDDKGPPGTQTPGFYPWFVVPGMVRRQARIVFGHWSSLGRFEWAGHYCVDTGAVWGQTLSAIKLSRRHPKWIEVTAQPRVMP